jgi:hypothetical protein
MSCYINIGQRTFKRVNAVFIKSSRKTLTDTATVRLANVRSLLDDPNKKIKVGDAIAISLGYNGNNNVEFTGYVSEIVPGIPLELKCENEMWQLKQQTVGPGMSWKSIELKDLLKLLVADVNTTECPDVTLSPFRIESTATKAHALNQIKEAYNLDIYFRDKKLYAGLAYGESGSKRVVYHFQQNVPTFHQQGGLIFKRKEDVKIKVRAVSLSPDNKKIEVNVGDELGETHSLHFFNLNQAQLTQQAAAMIDKLKYTGYRGTLKAFGEPKSEHGDVAVLQSDWYPDLNGDFFIDSVEKEYSLGTGFRRVCELGKKASQ